MKVSIERDEQGNVVRNDDGSVRMHYDFTDDDHTGKTVMMTGPIAGMVSVPDGTEYDVTPHFILVRDEHVAHVHRAILAEHHAAGRFLEVSLPE